MDVHQVTTLILAQAPGSLTSARLIGDEFVTRIAVRVLARSAQRLRVPQAAHADNLFVDVALVTDVNSATCHLLLRTVAFNLIDCHSIERQRTKLQALNRSLSPPA